jgi:hypothetical protein
LKEKRWIERTETGGFAITASGVDAVEGDDLILRKDRLIERSAGIDAENDKATLIEKRN